MDILHFGYPYRKDPLSLFEQVAVLMRNIVQYHVFVDGWKRIGIHICYVFLWKNGFKIQPSEPEEMFKFPMNVAKGKLPLIEIMNWFKENSEKN